MSRLRAFLAISGLAMSTWGCAQCDTCDDFPAPCVGPNCGMGAGYNNGPAPTTAPAAPAAPAGPSLGETSDTAPPPPATMSPAAPKPADPAQSKPLDLNRPNN